jgi:hypothetical protein
MNNRPGSKERLHLARIKDMSCGVCGAEGPSEAHHVEQHSQYLCIPLCPDCHRGSFNGLHGQKRIWDVKKLSELDVLNETLRAIL